MSIRSGSLFGGVQQELLDVVLLEVHHRRQLLVLVVGHLEVEHFGIPVEAAPAGPGQALLQEPLQRAQPLDDLQAAPGDADGAAAKAHRVVRLDHDRGDAVVGQPQGQREPTGPPPTIVDRMPLRLNPVRQSRQLRLVVFGRKRVVLELVTHRSLHYI